MRLDSFQTLTFDVYGTLIDWETGILDALRPLTARVKGKLSNEQVLEAHARHESTQQRLTPSMKYRDLLAEVYRLLAEDWRIPVESDECMAYGDSVKDWPAFPDSAEALRYLKKHYSLFVLSNVDNESFAMSNEKLGVVFDGVFTAEDIGSYKPDDRNFQFLIERLAGLGIDKEAILHTAESMFHDHAPANRVGLASCHIYRRFDKAGFGATKRPEEMPHFDFQFHSMAGFVDACKAGG